ncbi:MAG: hypothetical protein ACJ8C4_05865 [Gemmataceae bacterium]
MASRVHYRRRLVGNLTRLEDRLAPASVNSLLSQTNSSLYADTGGGPSYVNYDPIEGALPANRTMSANGRYTVFTSSAANLLLGQIDNI